MKAILFTLGVMLALNTAQAGDPAAGKKISGQCAGCHGADGNSVAPNYPKLAGQHEDYIIQALQDYKSGARVDSTMQGMASGLSTQDVQDVAAYYSEQQGLAEPEIE